MHGIKTNETGLMSGNASRVQPENLSAGQNVSSTRSSTAETHEEGTIARAIAEVPPTEFQITNNAPRNDELADASVVSGLPGQE